MPATATRPAVARAPATARAARRPDYVLLAVTAAVVIFGWLVLYSASALIADGRYGDQYYFLKRQMVWSALGVAAMLFASRVPLAAVQRGSRGLLAAVAVLLVLVLVVGTEVGGAKRWLRLGGFGIQPSEFAKLAMVIALADFCDRKQSRLRSFSGGYIPAMVVTGVIVGLVALERDLGTPFLICITAFGLIFIAGAKLSHLGLTALAAVPVLGLAIFAVPYRRQRFFAFLDPWKEAQGTGYQLVQSLLALGSGGFWGKGSGESTIKMFYMPESQTDFIFPIFGEEFGFVGTALLTLVFLFITHRCFRIAVRASHWFHALLSAGIGLMLGGQVLINLGVVTGLLPTKGIPLPFISFGGSSLLVSLTAIGLVLNVSRQPVTGPPVLSRRP